MQKYILCTTTRPKRDIPQFNIIFIIFKLSGVFLTLPIFGRVYNLFSFQNENKTAIIKKIVLKVEHHLSASCISVIFNSYTYAIRNGRFACANCPFRARVDYPPPAPISNLPQTAFSRNFLFFLFFWANFEGGVWCCFRFWCIFCVFCVMVHC